MTSHLDNLWLILGLGGLLLVWAGSLAAMRYWTRRQLLRAWLAEESGQEVRLPPNPRPEDQKARELIQKYRDRYLWKWWPETELSFQVINEMSLELIRKVAGIYYPQEDRPELKASLADLVAFHNRVGDRLAVWLETVAIRPFKDVELRSVIRYFEMYRSLKDHSVIKFIGRHRLHKVAGWSWAAFNFNSPFYWGRRAAYEMSRRLLMARMADLVGEEAMLLYGRRLLY